MQVSSRDLEKLETQLDNYDPEIRKNALSNLLDLSEEGDIQLPDAKEIANLHCHSFYSYNGYGYSPTHLAWIARKHGIKFMGVVDFDVLDAVDEFLDACEIAGIRGTAGIETRVFIPEFSNMEINSPGEPGVLYHMGTGFVSSVVPLEAVSILRDIKERATSRNREMLKRINDHLSPLSIDYEMDVLPLTPAGSATERHMVQVIADKAARTISYPLAYWSKKLNMDESEVVIIMHDSNKFRDLLRSKLMKRGGPGYIQPTADSFPTVDEFHQIMQSSKALPCSAWLDGTSDGEQDIEELLDVLIMKGIAALNIVPDRNWNIANQDDKQRKLKELYKIVNLANNLDLPILVGTEMNKFGQKLVDDFDTPELAPVKEPFIKGAYFLYGHTQLQRYWGIGYNSEWSRKHFPDRKSKNAFYKQAGQLILPGMKKASDEFDHLSPDEILTNLTI